MPAQVPPGRQCGDGIGERVAASGDGDALAVCFLVGLGSAHRDQQPRGFLLDVGQGQGGQLERRTAEA